MTKRYCALCDFRGTANEILDHLVIIHPREVELRFFNEGKPEMIFVLREYKARAIFK